MAAIKSNLVVEGHSQLESGSMRLHPSGHNGTFVGLYDGQGGPDASVFIKDHLFEIVKSKFALVLASVLSLAECDFLVTLVVQTDGLIVVRILYDFSLFFNGFNLLELDSSITLYLLIILIEIQ